MENKYIYMIKTFEKIEINNGLLDLGDERTVGYYLNLDDAEISVTNNSLDIYENLYEYALIEKLEEGLYPKGLERYFYKYNKEKDTYDLIDEPKEFKSWICLSLAPCEIKISRNEEKAQKELAKGIYDVLSSFIDGDCEDDEEDDESK